MRKFKRLLASVLTAAMLATFLPAGALAAEENDTAPDGNDTVITETQGTPTDEQTQPPETDETSEPDADTDADSSDEDPSTSDTSLEDTSKDDASEPDADTDADNSDEDPSTSDTSLEDTSKDDASEPDADTDVGSSDEDPSAPAPSLEDTYVTVGGEKVYFTPCDGQATLSLIPLEYHEYNLDLTLYFPDELKEVDLSKMLSMLKLRYSGSGSGQPIQDPNQVAAYAKWAFYDQDGNYVDYSHEDDYTLVDEDKTIDLSAGAGTGGSYEMELIIGKADQLNTSNYRYRIYVRVGYSDLLEPEAYTTGDTRQEIKIYRTSFSYNYIAEKNVLNIFVNPNTWTSEPNANLGLRLDSKYSDLSVKVYEGGYETEDAITAANAADITSQIMDQDDLSSSGGYQKDYSFKRGYTGMPEVTLVLARGNETVCVMPVILYIRPDALDVRLSSLYTASSDSRYDPVGGYSSKTKDGFDHYYTYYLDNGYKTDETYYVDMYADDPETKKYGANVVKGAYLGYLTREETEGKTDITSALFNNFYKVDFSQYPDGVSFTVIDINDKIWHIGLELEESGQEVPDEPTPLSQDTYFRMEGAWKVPADNNTSYSESYRPYVMSYEDDGDYYFGYQTVFLLDRENNPVPDGTTIYPEFFSGHKVEVYASHTENGETVSAGKQESMKSPVKFKSGEALQYSADAESGTHLKNYFVTFLTQQSKPTLFVNGINDESNWQKGPDGTKLPTRVVNLTEDYNYHHDIFFANVGADALTGLKVELTGADGTGEAENVKLDDYWTISETNSLAGFTTTSQGQRQDGDNYIHDPSGELPNVGKIRLVRQTGEDGKPLGGTISGLLTISADGVEPVKILLTGTAGEFQINTTELRDGVKYVSYSTVVQTNHVSDSSDTDAVRFAARDLPDGISIKPNGELYGIPTRVGTFTVTITATRTVDGETKSDTKTYSLTIEDNTNMNVWEYDQSINNGNLDYTPVIAIPNENMDGTNIDTKTASYGENNWELDEQILETHPSGNYDYFMDRVFIDNRQLIPGVDYTSEEGSIKLHIKTQTLRSFGNGTHTFTSEARIGSPDGPLRRTAQNYTLTTLGTSRPGGSSGSGSSGSSSSSDRDSGSSKPVSYAVNTPDHVENGTVSTSVTTATSGTKVTVTVTPDAGYTTSGVTVIRDRNGKAVSTVKVSDNVYTFIMPAGAVTATPRFTAIPVTVGSFYDVPADAWFCDAVKYVFDRSLMVGTSSNTFDPDSNINRSMLVTILYSLEGNPPVSGVSPFTDVQPGQWFTNPVIWAAENNLVAGLDDGTFGADALLTREQTATILYSYAQMKGYDVTPSSDLAQFTDTGSISAYALPALRWANATGLISGYDSTTLAPGGTTTRAQLAVILRSFCENIVK